MERCSVCALPASMNKHSLAPEKKRSWPPVKRPPSPPPIPHPIPPKKKATMRKPKEFKKFEDLLKRVLAVPKEDIDKRESEYRSNRKPSKRPKKEGSTDG